MSTTVVCLDERPRLLLTLIAVSLIGVACTTDSRDNPPRHVAPHLGGQPLPTGRVMRIAFGSCTNHMRDQPIWNSVVQANPDLFLHLGDAIYPDLKDDADASRVLQTFLDTRQSAIRCGERLQIEDELRQHVVLPTSREAW